MTDISEQNALTWVEESPWVVNQYIFTEAELVASKASVFLSGSVGAICDFRQDSSWAEGKEAKGAWVAEQPGSAGALRVDCPRRHKPTHAVRQNIGQSNRGPGTFLTLLSQTLSSHYMQLHERGWEVNTSPEHCWAVNEITIQEFNDHNQLLM